MPSKQTHTTLRRSCPPPEAEVQSASGIPGKQFLIRARHGSFTAAGRRMGSPNSSTMGTSSSSRSLPEGITSSSRDTSYHLSSYRSWMAGSGRLASCLAARVVNQSSHGPWESGSVRVGFPRAAAQRLTLRASHLGLVGALHLLIFFWLVYITHLGSTWTDWADTRTAVCLDETGISYDYLDNDNQQMMNRRALMPCSLIPSF